MERAVMEDLGRIVIDVNATGDGGAGGGTGSRMLQRVGGALTQAGIGMIGGQGAGGALAAQGLTKLAAMGTAGAIAAAPLIAVGVAGIALKKTFDFLNTAAKNLTESLREYSPQIMLADAMNEILMMQEKMRASAVSGGALARRELAQGRIDRVMFRVSDFLGRIGAIVVAPILEGVAKVLEGIEKKVMPTLLLIARMIAGAIKIFMQILKFVPGFQMYGMVGEIWINDVINSLKKLANNTSPIYQGNAPFIADLRLMGANV
jgi:hypothetical protein